MSHLSHSTCSEDDSDFQQLVLPLLLLCHCLWCCPEHTLDLKRLQQISWGQAVMRAPWKNKNRQLEMSEVKSQWTAWCSVALPSTFRLGSSHPPSFMKGTCQLSGMIFTYIYISYFLSYLPSVFSTFFSQKDQLWPEGKSFCRGGKRCPSNTRVFVRRGLVMWSSMNKRCDHSGVIFQICLGWWFCFDVGFFFGFFWSLFCFISNSKPTTKNHLHKS